MTVLNYTFFSFESQPSLMEKIVSGLKEHRLFFFGYFIIFISACLFLASNGKTGSFLFLNRYHRHWLDNFFIAFTYVGDGLFAILLVIIFYFVIKKRKLAVTLLLAYSLTGILAQLIKPLVHSRRPKAFFHPEKMSFFIDDIIHSGNNSFPSGHTVTAFALATVFAFYTNRQWHYILLLVLAVLAAFSRIYLAQHFLADVIGGSFIGVAGGIISVYLTRNLKENKLVFRKKKKVESAPVD
jgi:membrane-associated phospholipid phosphatase